MEKKLIDLYKENRPWGRFERFIKNEKCTVKILYVNPYSKTSLQVHEKRDEFWKVLEGFAQVELDDRVFSATEGDMIQIPKNLKHRISTEDKSCVIMEISLGEFNENDIVRLDDDYNRK